MPFNGIANATELRVMTEALDSYCRARGIVADQERDSVAERIVALFFSGCTTTHAILEALETGTSRFCRPPSSSNQDSHA